ncbi:MAG: DUF3857 domain-containing protein [Planctomycetota bacterium]
MRTPFRLVFLSLLGACTSGAPSPYAQDTTSGRWEISLAEASATQEPATTTDQGDAKTQQPSATAPPPPTEEDAYALNIHQDGVAAAQLYAHLMRQEVDALELARHPLEPDTAPDEVQIAAQLAELEWLAVNFTDTVGEHPNHAQVQRLIASTGINRSHGQAWSVLQWEHPDRVALLGRLTDWQFIGPFDNERGAALDNPIAPESAPQADLPQQGKVRTVTWRTTPETVPTGALLDFSQLLQPAEQSALLMRTWVESDAEQEVVLLLGLDGEVRVWHDGTPILEAQEQHKFHADALATPLKLHAGWNEITMKLGSRDHAPRIMARFVNPEAIPLHLTHTSSPPEEVQPVLLGDGPAPASDPSTYTNALAYYTAISKVSPENAQAFYRLAELQAYYQVTPIAQHPGRENARRAMELAPDVVRYRAFYAYTLFPQHGTSAAEVDLNPWLEQTQLVLAQKPNHPLVNFFRAQAATQYQHLESTALAAIDRVVAACAARPSTLFFRSQVLSAFGYDLLADQDLRAMLAHPQASSLPEFAFQAADSLYPSGSEELLRILQELHQASPFSSEILRSLLYERRLQRNTFDAELELAELDDMLALDPWNGWLRLASAERFQSQGDLETAFRLVQEALALKPESAPALGLLARLHLANDNLEGAVEALEMELEIDFAAEDESRLLDHLRSLDGASFEQPYRESLDAIIARHPEASAEEDATDYSHEFLLYRSVIRINPDSTADRYFRKVIRVLNNNGIRKLDVVSFPYSYGDEDLRVETVTVRHADGTEESARTARGWRGRRVDLPQLQVGDVIDLEWRVDDLHTTFFGKYFGLNHAMTPNRLVPTRESQLVLLVPQELPLKFHTLRMENSEAEVLETENFGTSHSWTVLNLSPERLESLMPPSEETVARVQASSYATWDDFGAWWWNLIDAGITVSPEMKDKVAELIEGKTSLREKVSAIYGFVANDIRYNAWEFGVHGYQPYTAPVIFSRQFGDCKDKGILIRAMLSEIGVEAYPVLILRTADGRHGGRRFEEDLSLAMVNHFNHCIAYIPAQQDLPAMFVDGTARLHPMNVLPYDDRGAQVLIVKPDGIERVRIPFSEASDNTMAQNFIVEYEATGAAHVGLIMEPSGRFDPSLRNAFAGGVEERKETVERILTGLLGPLEGEPTYDIPDVENLEQNLVLILEGQATNLARKIQGGLEIPFILERQGLLQSMAAEAARTTDLLLDSPMVRDIQYEIVLPDGWTLDIPSTAIHGATEDATYRWEIETLDGGSYRVHERFELLTHRIPVERYQDFRDLCRLVDSTQDRFFDATAPPPAQVSEEDQQ